MAKYVYIAIMNYHDDGYPYNEPFGPSDDKTIIGIYSSKKSANDACTEKANSLKLGYRPFTRWSDPKNGIITAYSFDIERGYIQCYYKKYELAE